MDAKIQTRSDIRAWLVAEIARELGIPIERIDLRARFRSYGLESAHATALIVKLGQWLGRPVAVTAVWEHPTIDALARHLALQAAHATAHASAGVGNSAAQRTGSDASSANPGSTTFSSNEPIAIVGVGCRFPGGAVSPEGMWNVLRNGVDTVTEIPASRWDIEAYFDADRDVRGKTYSRWGAFLDRVDAFDAQFFGISPREAASMDPQQRILLEVAWNAFEDAGIPPGALKGSAAGVFIGAMWNDYARLQRSDEAVIEQHTATGADTSIIAGRVSYALGLQGPSIVVNTACSSSLVAVHLACQSLRAGESSVALAGGVSLVVAPWSTIAMTKFGAMSPDGRCHAFDASANGYVRGEGAGVVVLKTLSRAIADGDRIYAVILASAVNNDGFSNGLTAPNPQAQEEVLRAAYARAGVEPTRVRYVETHGPGTLLGDPIEAQALGAALGVNRTANQTLRIGSVKTNFGHTEAAAGIAGLVKVALALKHGLLPPSLHFVTPNPHIAFDALGLSVQTDLAPWPEGDDSAIAGVSSFGFGGTNSHVVLQAAPASPPARVYPLAANGSAALRERMLELLSVVTPPRSSDELDAIARAVSQAHRPAPFRAALLAQSGGDLAQAILKRLSLARNFDSVKSSRPRLVWVCPGQGSQWLGMGRALLREQPVFRDAILACDRAIASIAGWSLFRELMADEATSRLDEVDVIQPVLFSIQVALGALWRSWGVVPDVVIGHSMGEVAAAHLAGILSLEDAVQVICGRSSVIRRSASGKGGMLVVHLPAAEALEAVGPAAERLVVAAYNGATSTVLSGDATAVDEAVVRLTTLGVNGAKVNVDYASHGPHMEALREKLSSVLGTQGAHRGIYPRAAKLRMISTVTVKELAGAECDASYWFQNLRQPVLFTQAVENIVADEGAIFLELSPHPVLTRAVESVVVKGREPSKVLASCERDEEGRMLSTLAELYERGIDVDWQAVNPGAAKLEDKLREDFPASWKNVPDETAPPAGNPIAFPIVLSASAPHALADQAIRIAKFLEAGDGNAIADVAFSLATTRTHLGVRASVVAACKEDAIASLKALAGGQSHESLEQGFARPHGNVVFVFPGQGSQWAGMGRALLRESDAFREAVETCDAALAPWLGFSITRLLAGETDASLPPLDRVDVVQPALFAMGIGLGAAWRALGLVPSAVVGHSQGEIAAAVFAGALSIEDGAQIVALRSRAVRAHAASGAMVLVEAPESDLATRLAPFGGALSIAAVNGPSSTVVSGDADAAAKLIGELEAAGVFCRRVNVDYASHSADMDGLLPALREELASIRPRASQIPIVSTVTGGAVAGEALGAEYWCKNLRQTVRFDRAIAALLSEGHDVFVEVSAHPVLTMALTAACGDAGIVVGTLHRDLGGLTSMYRALGMLHVHGHEVHWPTAFAGRGARRIPLPGYAFQRERHWIEAPPAKVDAKSIGLSTIGHPLLGAATPLAGRDLHLMTGRVSLAEQPWLADHAVYETVLLPGTAMVDMALAAGRACGAAELSELVLLKPLALRSGTASVLQVLVEERLADGRRAIALYARDEHEGGLWTQHATGWLRETLQEQESEWREDIAFTELAAFAVDGPPDGADAVDLRATYSQLAKRGLGYGPAFQGLVELHTRGSVAYARVVLPASAAADSNGYEVHPALLDAALHSIFVGVGESEGAALLPFQWSEVQVYTRGARELRVRVERSAETDEETTARVHVTDTDGRPVARIGSLKLRRATAASVRAAVGAADDLYVIQNEPLALSADRLGVGDSTQVLSQAFWGHAPLEILSQLSAGTIAERIIVDARGPVAGAHTTCGAAETALRVTSEALAVVQQWLTDSRFEKTELVWITQGALSDLDGGGRDLARAPLTGLFRTVRSEHPQRSLRVVDVSGSPADAAIAQRALDASDEPEIIVRKGRSFVPRLRRASSGPRSDRPFSSHAPGGTVLLTGGTGALGSAVAKHLVREHGVTRLVLASRRGLDEPAAAGLARELETAGASVTIVACDVARRADAERLIAGVDPKHPLTAIFHLAGSLADATVERQTPELLRQVFAGKANGAQHLHELTEGMNLAGFVLFSSVAGVLGNLGQANYAAANAYLDALAAHRRSRGQAAASLAWGLWKGAGMAAHLGSVDLSRMTRRGLNPIAIEDGLQLLDETLHRKDQNFVAARFDFAPLEREAEKGEPGPSILRGLIRTPARHSASTERAPQGSRPLRARLEAVETQQRLAEIVRAVQEEIAVVLKLTGAEAVPSGQVLRALGMDSLLALELKNRLSRNTGVSLPTTLAFDYPTPQRIAELLARKMFSDDDVATTLDRRQSNSAPTQSARDDGDEDLRRYENKLKGLSEIETLNELNEELSDLASLVDLDPNA